MPTLFPGSNARTIDSKVGEHVSILDFAGTASIWDGTTSADGALNAAITSITSQGNNGGTILLPGPAVYAFYAPLTASSSAVPVTIAGDGNSTIVKRAASLTAGSGLFDISGSGITFRDFVVEGNVTTSVGLRYNTDFNGIGGNDPMVAALSQNSSFWIHGGASNIKFQNVKIQHTGGYAILLDATTSNISDVVIEDCYLWNNRPNLFGTFKNVVNTSGTAVTVVSGDPITAGIQEMWINGVHYYVSSVAGGGGSATLQSSAGTQTGVNADNCRYGSWTGGILAHGDGRSGHASAVQHLKIKNSRFERNTGNSIWQHLYGLDTLHEDIQTVGNNAVDNGLDFILYGGVIGGNCADNHGRRIGYICTDDSSQSYPAWLADANATGIDTAGVVIGVPYTGNSMVSVNGYSFSLDGYGQSTVSGNSMVTPAVGDPEYTEDQIGVQGWGFSTTAGGPNIAQGINSGNTNQTAQGGYDVTITDNTIVNMGGGAIFCFAFRSGLITDNNIDHPANATFQPIVIGNIGTGANLRSYNNVIAWNHVNYSPSSPVPIVFEDANGFAFSGTDKNWVFGNIISSTSVQPCAEFYKDPNSASTTELTLSSNYQSLSGASTHVLRREASGLSSALKFYFSDEPFSLPPTQTAQLQGFQLSALGTVNTSGTTVTWISGPKFDTTWPSGMLIIINNITFAISTVVSATSITLTASAGTLTGVNWTIISPLLNVSNAGITQTGVLATGSRTQAVFGDCLVTGKSYTDAFVAMTDATYKDSDANLLPSTTALIRYLHTVGYFEQSITVSGGARVWTPLSSSGGTPAGADKDVQYNKAGAFGGDANLQWDYTAQRVLVTGISSTASIYSAVGYIQSLGGFVSSANSWQGINSTTDGSLLCGYALAPTGSSTGGYIDIAILGYANFPAPLNGLASFGVNDVILWASGTNGTASPNTTYSLMCNAAMNSIVGFSAGSASTSAINALSGGVTALWLIATDSVFWIQEAAPPVSAIGQSRIYMDSMTHTLMVSQNNSAYIPLVSAASVAGSNTQVQYNNSGAFGADAHFVWNYTSQILQVTATSSTVQCIHAITGYVLSDAGFSTTSSSTGAVTAPSGGVSALWLIASDSVFWIQEAAPALSSAGQSRIYMDSTSHILMVSQNGAAYIPLIQGNPAGADTDVQYNKAAVFGGDSHFTWNYSSQILTVTATSSAVHGIYCITGYIFSDAGFNANLSTATAFNAIQAQGGGMFAKSFTAINYVNTGNHSGTPTVTSGDSFNAGACYWDTSSAAWRIFNGSSWLYVLTSAASSSSFVSSLTASTGINISASTGAITITNTGVTFLSNGTGVSLTANTGSVTVSIGQSVATSANATFSTLSLTSSSSSALNMSGGISCTSIAASSTIQSTLTGASICFQGGSGTFQVNGSGQVSCLLVNTSSGYEVGGSTSINSFNQFVGAGVNVGTNGISCGNYQLSPGFLGATLNSGAAIIFQDTSGANWTFHIRGGIITTS